jgi:Zn-finger protein
MTSTECSFERCPANNLIQDLIRSRDKHEDKITKISEHLEVHMARSDEKHNQVIEKLTDIAEGFKNHTAEEMEHQKTIAKELAGVKEGLSENKFKQVKSEVRQNIIWGVFTFMATGFGALLFTYVDDIASILTGK